MKIHVFQHVSFEGPGYIAHWAEKNGYGISITPVYRGERIPDIDNIDALIVMGGPMNIYAENEHPWLKSEKVFIKRAISSGKIILGFCLGAQLIANALGQKVYSGPHKEIGWWPVRICREPNLPPAIDDFPDEFTTFHWHAETFDIPGGAIRFAESEAFPNQGFVYGNHVWAFQFHPEMILDGIEKLAEKCAEDLTDGPFVQNIVQMREGFYIHGNKANDLLGRLLDRIFVNQ